MPIRGATLNHQLHKNGARLHLAMLTRIHSHGADGAPSNEEQALLDERNGLKAARAESQAKALLPRPKPAKLLRTTRAAPKAKAAKSDKPPKEAKPGKAAKPHASRSEKHAQKAAALDAARRATKKSAKT
ncbi:MAG: hypothetical protein IV094_08185 [Vitreoscilla sp.]|nr:hypothetical protein [Vitreoscilla sp.]